MVIVKVYGPVMGGKAEIRCSEACISDFRGMSSYDHLYSRIQNMFPSLRHRHDFTLSWQDQEGDWVSLSSSDELFLAFRPLFMSRDESFIFRVRVALPEDSADLQQLLCHKCKIAMKDVAANVE